MKQAGFRIEHFVQSDYHIVFTKSALADHILFGHDKIYTGLISPRNVILSCAKYDFINSDFLTNRLKHPIQVEEIDHEDISNITDTPTIRLIEAGG